VPIIVSGSIEISNHNSTIYIKTLGLSIYLANIQKSIAPNIMRLYSSVCRNENLMSKMKVSTKCPDGININNTAFAWY